MKIRRLFFERCEDRLLLTATVGGFHNPQIDVAAQSANTVEISRTASAEGGFNVLTGNLNLSVSDTAAAYSDFAGDRSNVSTRDGQTKFVEPDTTEFDSLPIKQTAEPLRPFEPHELPGTMPESGSEPEFAKETLVASVLPSSRRASPVDEELVEMTASQTQADDLAPQRSLAARTSTPGTGFTASARSGGGFADVAILRSVDAVSDDTSFARNADQRVRVFRAPSRTENFAVISTHTAAELPPALAWSWKVDGARGVALAFDVAEGQPDHRGRATKASTVELPSDATPSPPSVSIEPATEVDETSGKVTRGTDSSPQSTDELADVAYGRRQHLASAHFVIIVSGVWLVKDYWQLWRPRLSNRRREAV